LSGAALGNRLPDVLRWPVVGALLRSPHARTSLQLMALAIAAVLVADGLFGPQFAPSNLATVVTWVHYRGLLIIALLAAGNLFCTGCPFVLVRDAGRRVHRPVLRWPRWLRTKWISIVLLVGMFFTYELFDLWALPRSTAYLIVGYFAAALAIDLLFAGATFCKYLCPIGQFNFIASTVSPLEVRVRQPDTCMTCRTFDCIKGQPQTNKRGCELGLFLPSKIGNLDCTFCLDCVQACPHQNVGLVMRVPGAELLELGRRSGVGRLMHRPDIAALVVVFAFGGLLNAFGMTAPAFDLLRSLARSMGGIAEAPALVVLFVTGLGVLPLVMLGGAAAVTRMTVGATHPISQIALRYAFALVPFGMGVWLAHYGFHLMTGALTIVPVTQSAMINLAGWAALGDPRWQWTGMQPSAVLPTQLGFVILGTIGSIAVAYCISKRDYPDRSVAAVTSWVVVVIALAIAAMWILSQPMEMRGLGVLG
jgi:hypothetical protein